MNDLIAEFIAETNESIIELKSEIALLEQSSEDLDLMSDIFRLLTAVYKTSSYLKLERLEKISKVSADLADKFLNKELEQSNQAKELLYEAIDQIEDISKTLKTDDEDESRVEPDGDDNVLISRIKDLSPEKAMAEEISESESDEEDEMEEEEVAELPEPLPIDASISVLVMGSCGEKYALPQSKVLEILMISDDSENHIEEINGTSVLHSRDRLFPLINLTEALELTAPKKTTNKNFIVICELGKKSFGLVVDKIYDTEEITVNPVSPSLRSITLYSGSTVLADKSVIMILDPYSLSQNLSVNATRQKPTQKQETDQDDIYVKFLVFRSGDASQKAVPIELVSRVEDIDASAIEEENGLELIKYQNELMRIARFGAAPTKLDDNKQQVIVFYENGKTLGLAIDEIVEIVDHNFDMLLDSNSEDYLGSMLINEQITNILNLSTLFDKHFPDWRNATKAIRNKKLRGNLLVIGENEEFNKFMLPMLRTSGYNVQIEPNGLEGAKALINSLDFDVIISDIETLEINGLEFAESCIRDRNVKHIPIIVISENAEGKRIESANKMGLTNHVLRSERNKLFGEISALLTQEQDDEILEES